MSRQEAVGSHQSAITRQADSTERTGNWNALWFVVLLASAPLGVFEFVLPLYGVALGADAATIGWLFSVFSITALLLRPLVGYLLDRTTTVPNRGTAFRLLPSVFCLLMIGLITYAVALSMFALAESTAMLVAARLVQGVASTTTWLTITVLLAEESDPNRRAAAFGRLNSLSVWGSGLGATWTLAVVGLFDGQTRVQIQAFLPELAHITDLPLDTIRWPTPILSSVTTLHIVFWGYVGFVVLALGFTIYDLRFTILDGLARIIVNRKSKIIHILRPQVSSLPKGHDDTGTVTVNRKSKIVHLPWPLLLASLLRSGGYALTLPVLTVYLDQRFGAGLVGVGLAYALPGVVYALAPGPLGRLADRVGHGRAAVAGLFASVSVYLALPLLPSIWLLVPLWTFEALCFSLAGPALSALLTDRSPHGARGSAFALYTLVGGVGAALTPALGGWLYDHFGAALPFWGNGLLIGAAAACVGIGTRLGTQGHAMEKVTR